MYNGRVALHPKSLKAGLVLFGLVIIAIAGFLIGVQSENALRILQASFLIGIVIGILRYPFIGIIITIVSLPLLELLPSIPYATSAISLLGGVTLASYLAQGLTRRQYTRIPFPNGLIWGALFMLWIFVTNPAAAILPDDGNRSWLFTFVQLGILAWLAARLLDDSQKLRVLMWAYSIAAVISASYAAQQGFVGQSIKESIRSGGLASGANAAARYYVVALLFLYILQGRTRHRLLRLMMWLGISVLIFGTLVTVSRTGLLLLVATIGLLIIQRVGAQRRIYGVLVFLIALFVTWIYADNVLSILRSILPAMQEGSDTIGLRYGLWRAAVRMWVDNPIFGVGIGQYTQQLPFYGKDLLPSYRLGLGAHNMYIQVLAETGIIGLILFITFLGKALYALWRAANDPQNERAVLAQTWFIVLLIMLIGGMTKHDHFDKLVWLSAGIGLSSFWKANRSALKKQSVKDTITAYSFY